MQFVEGREDSHVDVMPRPLVRLDVLVQHLVDELHPRGVGANVAQV